MLKSLEMLGFKSFADRTTFNFSQGITGIVGPNGSGKSNVVDAMKWILGDQSPKSLRGKEMTDVIFNGSGSRKPGGFAEATLTFDNTKRFLAIDTDEVSVGRRVYRSGEAEYLINRTPARLKDVRELFMGTGAGTSAYSIIEQGRVAALLESTTANRRAVFEEAAGISRFKVRKVDALRKLERVAQNLLRLTDIVEEVGGQLTTLRSQAVKATRFRENSEELRELWIGLAADDFRETSDKLHRIDARIAELNRKLSELSESHQAVEKEHTAVETDLAELEDQIREAERRAAANRETIASHEATMHHLTSRRAELEQELERLKTQQTELEARAEEMVGELLQTEGTLQKHVTDLESRRETLAKATQEIQRIDQEIAGLQTNEEQLRGRELVLIQQTSALQNRIGSFGSQIESLESSCQRALTRRGQLERQLTDNEAELGRRSEKTKAANQQLSERKQEWQAQRSGRDQLAVEQQRHQIELAALREQRSAATARKLLLEDLEERQEGLGIGAREILSRTRTKVAPWDTVLGSVADLLTVDLEQAALLELALGARAQIIVVSEFGPLLAYLNQGTCQISGRVGFLSAQKDETTTPTELATDVLPPSSNTVDLMGQTGVINRADRLVKTSEDIEHLAERLLADTWIVETLEVAFELASGPGKGCRFVTLQGELLDAEETLYLGIERGESSLMSRKSELRSLKNDLMRLDRQIQTTETELKQRSEALKKADEQLESDQAELQQLNDQISELKSALQSHELERDRLQREMTEIAAEVAQWRTSQEDLKQQTQKAQETLTEAQTELESAKQSLAGFEGQRAKLQERRQDIQREQNAEQLELAKFEERLQSLQHARSRLDQDRAERALQRDEAERRLQQIVTKVTQIDEQLEVTRTVVAEQSARNQEFQKEVAVLQENRDRVRQKRGQLSERELKMRHERRELQEQVHGEELKTREFRQQLEHLSERLRDEYQVELKEVTEAGASAVRAIQAQREAKLSLHQPDAANDGEHAVSEEPTEVDVPNPTRKPDESETAPLAEDAKAIRTEVQERIDRLRRKLKAMGNVNTDSLQDLDEMESRYERLSTQLQDLVEAKSSLEEIVRRINNESKRMFAETFAEIRTNFQELFRKMFGGGDGDIVLEDPEDVLECGIDIVARPPGKELRSITLLSGGEKTLTAFALLMAIFRFRPSPFCVLDEVDAPLDDANKERYVRGIHEFKSWTQFIVITHAKPTMTAADVLHGVTMEEAGVSKRMSVRFEDVSEDGNFRNAAA